jgi:hypothetical protein
MQSLTARTLTADENYIKNHAGGLGQDFPRTITLSPIFNPNCRAVSPPSAKG